VPLATDDDSLEIVGGKGRPLSQLSHAGFTVPTGFLLTTAAYRAHIVAHDLQGRIVELSS
jgi:pyruvate,water dikinase